MPSATTTTHYCASCLSEFEATFGYYCHSCLEWRCEDCGRCEDTGFCSEEDTDDDCDSDSTRDLRVLSWDYRPLSFRPKGNYPNEALLGVELEVGGLQDQIADAVERVGDDHLYMKEDGSICGVEIVTHPMTLAWARKYPFGNLLRELRNAATYVDDDYGLHIHVSRNAFQRNGKQSAAHQMMWLLFIYRNVDSVERLARRSSDRWASFRKPFPGELARKAKSIDEDDRYVAVNCNNEKTYELRFFKSTLDEQEFYAALEFADASVRYTRALSIRDVLRGKAITWRHFTAWVRRHNYRYLLAEISR
ncbi:amidoligase family protein [Mycobacteroides abscessus]|uniref:amidoligase family protein n=1 Tax=Mycobacteroides abscessus TaxID=36809 RepID=UPI0009A82833|nr:amidoligase family protein [Mycobacteroides abscessus]SKT84773.1 Putative amidoligase enzyme [Mycobacteroides abscessus subsp. massiliense]SKU05925.1 Putative amidoligase enzyme [Mycobacteroides abscessus subsp. massiliense]